MFFLKNLFFKLWLIGKLMVKLVRVCVFEAFNLLTTLWNYFTLVQYFFNFYF